MILFYSLIILIIPFIISINVLTYRLTIKKALNNYIIPKLKENDLVFIDYSWPGLFSNGKFKDDPLKLTFMNKNGQSSILLYADIIYYTTTGETKKITARIDTTFFIIKKISYSADF